MDIIITLLYFLITSNVVLLLLLGLGFRNKVTDTLLLFFSYGVGPFIPALIFYGLIWLFPDRSNLFYVLILSGIYFLIFTFGINRWRDLKDIYSGLWSNVTREIKSIPKLVIFIIVSFVGLYMIQLFAFPVIGVDNTFYVKQSEAFYKYKNISWTKETQVILDSGDYYRSNYAVRPGIPLYVSFIYLLKGYDNFFSFRFLIYYYYILLFVLFIYLVVQISLEVNSKRTGLSLLYAIFSYLFFWCLTRFLIYSYKELIIYFLALLSIYLVILLLKKKRKAELSIIFMLAVTMGINSFVNFHGIVIEFVVLFLIFLFFRHKLIYKIYLPIFIFLLSVPFGSFELFQNFKFLLLGSLGLSDIATKYSVSANFQKDKYQISNDLYLYLKGKLQFITSIGVYGFNFWLLLFTLVRYFKNILNHEYLKIIFFFMITYFLLVIDPLKLNKHPLTIVLDASSKYPALIVLLGMIISSVFMPKIVKTISLYIERKAKLVVVLLSFGLTIALMFRIKLINLITSLLLLVVPVVRNFDYYHSAIEKFYFMTIIVLFAILLIIIYTLKTNRNRIYSYAVNFIMTFVIIAPFFTTDVGKVPLKNSLHFIGRNQNELLEETIYQGDIYKVFSMATSVLPKQTLMCTGFKELLIYNHGYFIFIYSNDNDSCLYKIVKKCGADESVMFCSPQACLCRKDPA